MINNITTEEKKEKKQKLVSINIPYSIFKHGIIINDIKYLGNVMVTEELAESIKERIDIFRETLDYKKDGKTAFMREKSMVAIREKYFAGKLDKRDWEFLSEKDKEMLREERKAMKAEEQYIQDSTFVSDED